MISRFIAFLSDLLHRSNNHQQWERILGKQLESGKPLEGASSFQLKRTAKIQPYSTTRPKKLSLPMLVPQNSILLWKDPVDLRTNYRSNSLSLLFNYDYNGSSLLVALRRPLSEPFSETAKKIEFKIQKMTAIQMGKKTSGIASKSALSSEHTGPTISVETPSLANRTGSLTLEEVMNSEQLLLVGGTPYTVIHEPVDIASLTCAIKPLAGCPVYPAVDFRQGSSEVKPIFHWYIYTPRSADSDQSKDKSKDVSSREAITMVGGSSRRFLVTNCDFRWTGGCYVPSAVDSGKLIFLVADLGPEAIVKCGVSKFPIEVVDEPLICEHNIKWCQEEKPPECVRVVSYNILADLYLDLSGQQESLFFPYCPKTYQIYEYRYPLLLKELLSYGMDLCFLQEVDNRMQMRYLSALFDSINMEMYFARKQKEVTEGSVIAFCRDRFELLSSECYGLASLLDNICSEDVKSVLYTSTSSLEIFATRPTTIQVAVLRDRQSNGLLICGNTHLHHNPMHEHLKALQAIVAVRQLDSTRRHYASLYPQDSTRLLFAGDFNSTPDGPVYELLSTGVLPKSSNCWKLDESIEPRDMTLLPSGKGLENLTGTGLTNYTKYKSSDGEERGFAGCLDYIWTDSATILHRLAPRPPLELITKYGALPSKIAPSDHVPLICEVNFSKE